ncbi:MAG TPA: UvrD-helicase domain-containing protein [Opitutus sp.]|nr:UvrD-helicase domain-containing protein [Opitutus sp.]
MERFRCSVTASAVVDGRRSIRMTTVENIMILASAGSGKTYALTNRFVRLLALGAKPERIVALTFTRKAAGEFFDEILKKLAHAASDANYAKTLAAEIGVSELGSGAFLKMLSAVVTTMPRLQLGTFDGFFARIARNFPLELGLAGEFEILQEHASKVERARVLRRMFERAGELGDAQREFIEAFKRATFGADEKRLGAQLDSFLDQHQEIFLSAPEPDYWGNERRIWPAGGEWVSSRGGAAESVKILQNWVSNAKLADKQRLRWEDFIKAWSEWAPGVVPERPLAYVLEKTLAAWSEVEAGCAVLEFDRKKQELSPAACAALAELARHVVASEIARRLEMTRGIHAVLQSYESVYHDVVRRAGKLTFSDVQRLLVPSENGPGALSQNPEDDRRLYIDFRLDAEIDHWLLDEFQDTSFGQWSVLRNLVDEALQDPTGGRSFFYVGDVKQAIFAWRDGDPRLFREIFDHYNEVRPGTIQLEHLVKSWRSGPAVISAVNQVFGDAAVLAELFPGEASDAWNREWRPHESAKPQQRGQVALLHADDEAGRFDVALSILREIDPLARGLTCGVLVQTNQMAATFADFLRKEGGIPAVAESDLHVCVDNPLGRALLALVKAAAHPGDSLAAEHLKMCPLGPLLVAEGMGSPEAITHRVLAQIHAEGFERSMAFWIRRLHRFLATDDAFSRERGKQFVAAAGLFDATGSRSVAEFIRFMERYSVRDVEGAAVVRVMTIHKAKGLGFDLVLLPDLEGMKLDCRRDGLAVQKAPDRSVEWILDLPGKLFHAQDEVLSAHVRSVEANACYEGLSLLYVAMTRAKHAMYVITKAPGTSTSRNYPKLLAETLGEETTMIQVGDVSLTGGYALGEGDWFAHLKSKPTHSSTARIEPIVPAGVQRRTPLIARRPSGEHHSRVGGARLFSLEQAEATEFGTLVHRLLAEVEWGGPESIVHFESKWRKADVPAGAVDQAMACLESADLAGIWQKPAFGEVWRERAFEVVIKEQWITGVFDRVVIERDSHGEVRRVEIIDFKTDRVAPAAVNTYVKSYASQLELYRRVAAILTGVPLERIGCRLVFTRLQRAIEMKPMVSPT